MKFKFLGIFIFMVLAVACERFPVNPPGEFPKEPAVDIQHISTEYVEVDTTFNGIASDKVNVLSFSVRVEYFTARALEFYGKAIMAGPPDGHEHVVHFRTDDVSFELNGTGYEFNILPSIGSETYTLVRAKFPTNEYAPFHGIQGRIESLEITEVWAHPDSGKKYSVALMSQ